MPLHIQLIDAYADQAIEKLNGLGIADVTFSNETTSETLIYAINIDAPTYKEKYSNQNGIIKLREILHSKPNAKFILYSFQSQDALTAQKPENEIINHLPFIRLPFEEASIKAAIEKVKSADYPFFNTAAENLLSGWALSGKEMKIDFPKKSTTLIVDDDFKYWKATFKAIFKGKNIESLLDESKEASKIRIKELLNGGGFNDKEKEKLKKAGLIIADLYLTEEHREGFSTKSNRHDISGYKIYRKIRAEYKITPVMMLTTSNKTWNYRLFEDAGIHEWCVKENNHKAESLEKQTYFEDFKENINHVFGEKGKAIIEIGKGIEDLQGKKESIKAVWQQRGIILEDTQLDEIYKIMSAGYLLLRRTANRDVLFEKNIKAEDASFDNMLCCAIISQLGIVPETIYKAYANFKKIEDAVGLYVFFLRNAASHVGTSKHFNIDDVIIVFKYLLWYLDTSENLPKIFPTVTSLEHQKDKSLQAEELLLFDHIAFNGLEISKKESRAKNLLENRIRDFAEFYYKGQIKASQDAGYYKKHYPAFVEINDAFPNRVEIVETQRNGKKRLMILYNPTRK